MGSHDRIKPSNEGGPDETSGHDFSVTRRTFLGGVGASAFATTAFANEGPDGDEIALRFTWNVDVVAGGARVLDVSIVAPGADVGIDSETSDNDAPASDFSEITGFSNGTLGNRFWRIRPESFGPDAGFSLRTSKSGGRLRYSLRISNVAYGRIRGREITFHFQQTEFRLPDHQATADRKTALRFVLTAVTDIWSSETAPTATNRFSMAGEIEGGVRKVLRFRDFLAENGAQPLFIDVPLRRITNTAVLMFNGLISPAPGTSNPTVGLRFRSDGKWHVSSDRPAMSAFSGRVPLKDLTVFWPLRDEGATAQAAREAPLLAVAVVAHDPGSASKELSIGTGQSQPGFRGAWQTGTGDAAAQVFFRMQRPRDGDGATIQNGMLRAEAMLQTDWSDVAFQGATGLETTSGLPPMKGSLLERIDFRIAPSNTNPANRAGSLSFQAEYSATEGAFAVRTGLGKITAHGVRGETDADEAADSSFPTRRGWPVTALFNWYPAQNGKRPATRAAPATQFIEAEIAMLEAGVALPGAEFSRLTFDPTALRIFYADAPLAQRPLGSFIDLAPRGGKAFARIDLARARLRASRTTSLLALTFRFSDLALEFRENQVAFVSYNTSCEITTRPGERGALQPHDARPVLVVDFPPQHMFEETRFFQTLPPLPDVENKANVTVIKESGETTFGEAPYAAPGDTSATTPPYVETPETISFDSDNRVHLSDAIDAVKRAGHVNAIKDFRAAIRSLKTGKVANLPVINAPAPNADPATKQMNEAWQFAELAKKLPTKPKPWRSLPEDQMIYVGPVGMDVDVRHCAREVYEDIWTGSAGVAVRRILDTARQYASREDAPGSFDAALGIAQDVEGAMPLYQRFRDFYRESMLTLVLTPDRAKAELKALGVNGPTSTDVTQIEHIPFAPESAVFRAISEIGVNMARTREEVVRTLFQAELFQRDTDALASPSRGRLSGTSRLAFRVRCRDGLADARARRAYDLDAPEDAEVQLPREELAFDLDALTRFRGMELAVMSRAEIVYDPGELGLIAARRPRVADTSSDAMLERLGFNLGKENSVRNRLADVVASLKPPTPLETAIEIPARLTLSPHQNAVVLTPHRALFDDVDDDAKTPFDLPLADTSSDPTAPRSRETHPLWQARFVTEAYGFGLNPGVRAVYSPDLRPGALLSRFADQTPTIPHIEPPAGPFAPWHVGLLQGQSPGISEAELKAIYGEDACTRPDAEKATIVQRLCAFLAAQKKSDSADQTVFRAPIDARDRHQLVLLSSAWGLPVVGRRDASGNITGDASQFEPTARSNVWDVEPGSAIYQPRTLDVTELAMSCIGGTLRHDTGFQPPVGAHFWRDRRPVFDALSVERWQQWTNLGRDVFTEVVYKGFLFPLGIRASLVKVTERIIHFDAVSGTLSAPLRQRMFIRVANPKKLFPALKQPFGGRRFPVGAVNLLTTVTPDIVDPNEDQLDRVPLTREVAPKGRIKLGNNSRGIAFWPRIFQALEGNIRFEMDVDGVKTDLPLIFVDNVAANDEATVAGLVNYYADAALVESPDETTASATTSNARLPAVDPVRHLRTLIFNGAERRYSEEIEAGGATYQTDHWTLVASGHGETINADTGSSSANGAENFRIGYGLFTAGPAMQGADQPPFFPVMQAARVHLTQTERLSGAALNAVRAHFDSRYLAHGFPAADRIGPDSALGSDVSPENPSEVVLILRDQPTLDMGRKGDQSGGVFRPSGRVVALSRKKGALTRNGFLGLPAPSPFASSSFAGLFAAPSAKTQLSNTAGSGTSGQSYSASEQEGSDFHDALADIRKVFKSYLGDDSKILGLVSLRDLIDLIQRLNGPEEGLPDLAEKLEFGAGLLDDVADGVNFIRERIVSPLASIVRSIREEWNQIEDNLNAAQQGLPTGDISIREIFPELDISLTNLAAALSRAEGETDEILFALELGACYSSGQQFLGALQRAAANPGQRVEEALARRYTAILGLLRGLENGIESWLQRIVLTALKDVTGIDIPDDAEIPQDVLNDIQTALLDKLRETALELISDAIENARDNSVLEDRDHPLFTTEIFRLPRTRIVYQPENKSRFEECLAKLVPDQNDVTPVFDALVDWLLEPAKLPDRILALFGPNPPTPDSILRDFLADTSVQIAFEPKAGGLIDATNKVVVEDLHEVIDKIGTDLKAAIAANADFAAVIGDAEVDEKIEDLKDRLTEGAESVFAKIGDGTEATLRSGPVSQQIRNRYLLCVLINLSDNGEECIPVISGIDPRYFRNFFDWVEDWFEGPSDIFPDMAGLFDPIIDIFRKIVGLLRALTAPDLKALMRWFREVLGDIDLPDIEVGEFCDFFDPIWQATSTVMTGVADLGAFVAGDSETPVIVLHPYDWTGPPCPLSTSMAGFVETDGTIPPFSAERPQSLSASIFAIRAHTDVLIAAVDGGTTNFRTLANTVQAEMANLETELRKLDPDLSGSAGREVRAQITRFAASLERTTSCLRDISTTSGQAYCDLGTAMRAIRSLNENLRLAARLNVCNGGTLNREALDSLIALAHLPRDVRAVGERSREMVASMQALLGSLVNKIEEIRRRARSDEDALDLLVLLLPAGELLAKFRPPASTGSTTGDQAAAAVNTALDELQKLIGNFTTGTTTTTGPMRDMATNLVAALVDTVCRLLRMVEATRVRIEALITEAEEKIAAIETALDTGAIPEVFRAQAERVLARVRTEANIVGLKAEFEAISQDLYLLREIEKEICGEPGQLTPFNPGDTLIVLDGLTVPNPDLTSAKDLPAWGKAVRETGAGGPLARLTSLQDSATRGLKSLPDELRSLIERGPREAMRTALAPLLVEAVNAEITVGNAAFTDSSGQLTLASIYAALRDGRNEVFNELVGNAALGIVRDRLIVPPDAARPAIGTYVPNRGPAQNDEDLEKKRAEGDQLSGDAAWLAYIRDKRTRTLVQFVTFQQPVNQALNEPGIFAFLSEFTREWSTGDGTPVVILEQVVDLVEEVLSGDVFKNIDFAAIRDEIEDYLLSLVPSKLRMGYDFEVELGCEVAKATAGIFAPKKDTRLGIDMKILVDLLAAIEGEPSIDFQSIGTLGPFDIKLVGTFFDALTLRFASAEFISEGGSKSDIKIVYTDHKIGPKLEFVKKLQKFLAPKDGSGAIIRFFPSQPGLEAGYRLHLGDFSVGNLAFTNVGLETTAILPFSDSEALFKASLSSRANPFTLTYAPYGGSGFFAIFANVEGIVGFEASFEFGGSGVFAAGPLTGQGRIMSGVYIRQLKLGGVKITELAMTFFAGGSASIWIFNFAAALSVKMGMVNGAMTGEAVFSFSFSMGLGDYEYSVTLFKQEGEGFRGQSASLGPGLHRLAANMGAPSKLHQKANRFGAKVETEGQCQSRNWAAFKNYFDDSADLGNYF